MAVPGPRIPTHPLHPLRCHGALPNDGSLSAHGSLMQFGSLASCVAPFLNEWLARLAWRSRCLRLALVVWCRSTSLARSPALVLTASRARSGSVVLLRKLGSLPFIGTL